VINEEVPLEFGAAAEALAVDAQAEFNPLLRPYDEIWLLAGFLDADSVREQMPGYDALPDRSQQEIAALFGAAAGLAVEPLVGHTRFARITEPNVLRLLRTLAGQLQPATSNLVGFEWVEIAPMIAGQFATGRRPAEEDFPNPTDAESLARFCLFTAGAGVGLQVSVVNGKPVLVSPAAVVPQFFGWGAEADTITLKYKVAPLPNPIRVLVTGGRTIALTGIERLAALHSIGVERALCLVHYGYGMGMLGSLPRVPADVLQGARPPLVRDALDPALSVSVPVRPTVTVCAFDVHTTKLG
jgi:hypothetical protein